MLSSSSSSSSSGIENQRRSGIPLACNCGMKAVIRTSRTKENPGRRFFCCSSFGESSNRRHLFKWLDESLFEETLFMKEEIGSIRNNVHEWKTEMLKTVAESKEELKDLKKKIKYLSVALVVVLAVEGFVSVLRS